ncbi:MAG: hypothetical protein KGL95_05985 [Patescibacteria group bacterium]|nr:hypothetical protein [Patescibacteria group bacterium]
MENHIEKLEEGVTVEIGKCEEKGCTCNGHGRVPHAKITIEGLKESYKTNDNIEFSVHVRGFGSHSGLPNVWIRQLEDAKRQVDIKRLPKHDLSYLLEPTPQYIRNVWSKLMTPKPNSTLENFERTMKFPSNNEPPLIIKEHGQYELRISVIPNEKKQIFEIK